jgi:membrane fusion protein, multidrug efflux system
MKIIPILVNRTFFLALLTLTALTACEDNTKLELATPNTWQVPVAIIEEENLPERYTVIGSVVADKNIDISSRISSYIRRLTVQEGEAIDEGQLLIVLDDEELDHNINQAKAAVQSAQAILTDIKIDLNRYQNLLEQGSISAIKVRKTQLQKSTAQENLHSAKAALAVANSQRQYIQIKSPVSGIITKRHLQAGSLATPGMPLLTIESRDNLKFDTFVAESQLAHINLEDSVKLDIDNVAEPIIGKVTQIIYSGHPVTRSYKVSIALPTRPDLYTGMFGSATFIVGINQNITIPSSALTEKGGLQGVYVIDKENKAWFRWVRIRRNWPGKLEIAAGLSAGEKIVVIAPANIREGDLVEVNKLESLVIKPRVTELRVTELRVTEPRVTEPKVAEPRIAEPRVEEAQ